MPALLESDPVVLDRDLVTGDLIMPLRFASGLRAVLIQVRVRLLLWRDEWYLNRDVGMPYLETEDGVVTERDAILGQRFDAAKTARAVRGEILTVPGALDVPELRCSFDGPSRVLSIAFVVRTRFGDSEVTTVALAA